MGSPTTKPKGVLHPQLTHSSKSLAVFRKHSVRVSAS